MADGKEEATLGGGRLDCRWHWFLKGFTGLDDGIVVTAAAGELHVAIDIRGAHMLLRECHQNLQ